MPLPGPITDGHKDGMCPRHPGLWRRRGQEDQKFLQSGDFVFLCPDTYPLPITALRNAAGTQKVVE